MSEKSGFDLPNLNRFFREEEIQQNFNNINKILEGKEKIDYMGINTIYSYMFVSVARQKKVIVQYIDPRIDPAEIERTMCSDSLVVSGLSEDTMEKISQSLNGKKNIIVGRVYMNIELGNNSGMHM